MADSYVTLYDALGGQYKLATDLVDGVHTLKSAGGAGGGSGEVKVVMTEGGNVSIQTNASGATYNSFGPQACTQLTLVNDTGTDIEWRQDGAGVALTLKDGTAFTIFGITNANQIGVRRKDVSNTQVTLGARWEG